MCVAVWPVFCAVALVVLFVCFAFVIVGCVCVWDVLCDVVWFAYACLCLCASFMVSVCGVGG